MTFAIAERRRVAELAQDHQNRRQLDEWRTSGASDLPPAVVMTPAELEAFGEQYQRDQIADANSVQIPGNYRGIAP